MNNKNINCTFTFPNSLNEFVNKSMAKEYMNRSQWLRKIILEKFIKDFPETKEQITSIIVKR